MEGIAWGAAFGGGVLGEHSVALVLRGSWLGAQLPKNPHQAAGKGWAHIDEPYPLLETMGSQGEDQQASWALHGL